MTVMDCSATSLQVVFTRINELVYQTVEYWLGQPVLPIYRLLHLPDRCSEDHFLLDQINFCSVWRYFQAAPAREDCVLLLAACHNGHSDRTLSAAVFPWRPEENLKHIKKKRNRQ
ncbi:hypothetical protein TNCV_2273071 [Trichonephila clavipes]|nr:hypothetical protein TNCV_2273071 [Trichonephila clavipes]